MKPHQIKTASDLKAYMEYVDPDNCFFSRSSMRFFGDHMANFAIRHHLSDDGTHLLELYRRREIHAAHKHLGSYFYRFKPSAKLEGMYEVVRVFDAPDRCDLDTVRPADRERVLGPIYN